MPTLQFDLAEIYHGATKLIVTAHRGLSGLYPENTIEAMQKAIEIGADLVEFDVRATRDGVPVILHDATIDRTSNGTGRPEDHTLSELKRLNFSFWHGSRAGGDGRRLEKPARDHAPIPTFEEVLEFVADKKIGLNIQVYTKDPEVVRAICKLYGRFDMYRRAYFAMSTFDEARAVKALDPEIGLCVLERQSEMHEAALDEMVALGCRFVQPRRKDTTAAFCRACRERGLLANMFYSNDREDARQFMDLGLPGILTDRADLLVGMPAGKR